MFEYVVAALTFGLAGGLKPGPLGMVVIQQTLAHGFVSGVRASLAPLVTDGPIILAVLLLLPQLRDVAPFVAAVSLMGGIYLLWIGGKLLRLPMRPPACQPASAASLRTAIKVNLLNPGPYLFWFSIGGTYILLGSRAQALVFVVVAIGTLIGAKVFVAALAAKAKPLLHGVVYARVMQGLAGGLMFFGCVLLMRGAGYVR